MCDIAQLRPESVTLPSFVLGSVTLPSLVCPEEEAVCDIAQLSLSRRGSNV